MASQQHKKIAVVGAIAYDQIATTATPLSGTTEPLLNCKLTSLNEAFGGCGGNIAYNLAALGSQPTLITCTGQNDDERYLRHCVQQGIQTGTFLRSPQQHCARAIIITDPDGRQFTGFFPGPVPSVARWRKHLASIDMSMISVFVQAPYPPEVMQTSLEHAARLKDRPLKICCPGQYADQLNSRQIDALAAQCDWLIGNAHEITFLRANTQALSDKLVIQTNGASPIQVTYPDGKTSQHKVPASTRNTDPTGCGDAFIAAIAHHVACVGEADWHDILPQAIAVGNNSAAACLRCSGAQQHSLSHLVTQ